jgi:hypothetical protein
MAEQLSIVKRIAKFIEGIHEATGERPRAIVINERQLHELAWETGVIVEEGTEAAFWGIPLIIDRSEHGASTIENH